MLDTSQTQSGEALTCFTYEIVHWPRNPVQPVSSASGDASEQILGEYLATFYQARAIVEGTPSGEPLMDLYI